MRTTLSRHKNPILTNQTSHPLSLYLKLTENESFSSFLQVQSLTTYTNNQDLDGFNDFLKGDLPLRFAYCNYRGKITDKASHI